MADDKVNACGCDFVFWLKCKGLWSDRKRAKKAWPKLRHRISGRAKAFGAAVVFRVRWETGRCEYPSNLRFVYHGNWCGPGHSSPGKPPIDDFDCDCMHHDNCVNGVVSRHKGRL